MRRAGVDVRTGVRADVGHIVDGGFAVAVVASGVRARAFDVDGADDPRVVSYQALLTGAVRPGRRVVVVGAGGIGFDVAVYLVERGSRAATDVAAYEAMWGIDPAIAAAGGLAAPVAPHSGHEVVMLKRSKGPFGKTLGKTTGWIHRATLKMKNVKMIGNVNYERIGDDGLLISYGDKHEDPTWLDVDNVVLCAGQEPLCDLKEPLQTAGIPVYVIGGADIAAELDAKRAIDQGSRLAAKL